MISSFVPGFDSENDVLLSFLLYVWTSTGTNSEFNLLLDNEVGMVEMELCLVSLLCI